MYIHSPLFVYTQLLFIPNFVKRRLVYNIVLCHSPSTKSILIVIFYNLLQITVMGRTIPSFRIAALLEEKEWKLFRKYLNKKDRKAFDDMFSIARLYNSACSYASIPIRIYPIMMSIALHHYKTNKKYYVIDNPK